MDEDLVKSVQDMLKEETWTRATISNYTKNNLIELAGIVEKARNSNCGDELQKICDEHLSHTKDSIIALYISGMLSLYKEALDNSALVSLVDIFQKNHKEALVSYLCEEILADEPNNKFALRTLAECYRADNNDKMWDLYATIVKLDFEEADMAKALAEHYETLAAAEKDADKAAKEREEAVGYYKKALLRYVNAKNINSVKEIWSKLVQMIPEEIDFFMLAKRKVAKTISEDKSAILMQELYVWYKDNKKWDTAIDILKQNLEIDPHDTWARKEIVDCYRGKYEGHSNVEEYIRSSNLTQSFRNVFEAINDFEKHIAFDVHSYVFHREWHVGRIRKVENDTLTINFGKKVGIREMSLKMAVSALTPLAPDHIWVLKATKTHDELAKKIKEDKKWALTTIIKSFDNNCDFKRIKAELVSTTHPEQSLLTPGEWTSWNSQAKKVLEENSEFGVNPNDINMYMVRDHEISQEAKLANEFKAQKQFFARIDILMKFMENDEADRTSELFNEMLSYFTGYLKSVTKVNEQVLASYLVLQRINAMDKTLSIPLKYTFAQIYGKIADPREMYTLLKDTKNTHLREDFLADIKMLPNWAEEYIRLFPTVLEMDLITALVNNGHKDMIEKLAQESFDDYKDYRMAVLFFFGKCQNEDWFKEANIPYEKQLIALISIIEQNYREINNHVNTTENKKIIKNACELLFDNDALVNYVSENDEESAKRMYTLVNDINDLDGSYKQYMRNKILEKFPTFKFHVTEEKAAVQRRGMMVTAKKLEEKKAEVEHIQREEMPKNAAEIAEAKRQGDLKENAEYKAAREYQHYLSVTLTRLEEELNRAVVFDPTTITTSIVSFATTVTLQNNLTNKVETFTILGPWESDPDNGIISYMSPLGNKLMDMKVGETSSFSINETKYDYTVKDITAAKL